MQESLTILPADMEPAGIEIASKRIGIFRPATFPAVDVISGTNPGTGTFTAFSNFPVSARFTAKDPVALARSPGEASAAGILSEIAMFQQSDQGNDADSKAAVSPCSTQSRQGLQAQQRPPLRKQRIGLSLSQRLPKRYSIAESTKTPRSRIRQTPGGVPIPCGFPPTWSQATMVAKPLLRRCWRRARKSFGRSFASSTVRHRSAGVRDSSQRQSRLLERGRERPQRCTCQYTRLNYALREWLA